MKVRKYYIAKSLEDAYAVLQKDSKNAILGGGLWLKKANSPIDTLIDISKLGLDRIIDHKDHVEIGSLVSEREFEISESVKSIADGIVSIGTGEIMGVPFRHMATIGGSVAGKYPFSDIITPLLALDVTLHFYPERKISLSEYLSNKDKLGILVSISIKKEKARGYFKKVEVTALDFPIVNIAICKVGNQYRISVGSRPSVASLALEAMSYLNGIKHPEAKDFERAAELASTSLRFSNSPSASEEYRRALAKTYVRRGLEEVNK